MSIGFIIFIVGLVIGVIGIVGSLLLERFNNHFIVLSIIGMTLSIASLIGLHFIPYTYNVFDAYKVEALEENIEYYSDKIERYEREDKKVLEEWARQQEEMAKKLSSIGVQFAGDIEPNNIIKKLSIEIQKFHREIDNMNLEIHDVSGEINAREAHKSYWGL
jgi:hypothetical protein